MAIKSKIYVLTIAFFLGGIFTDNRISGMAPIKEHVPIEQIGSYQGPLQSILLCHRENSEFGACFDVRRLLHRFMRTSFDGRGQAFLIEQLNDVTKQLQEIWSMYSYQSVLHEMINMLFHCLIFHRPFNFERACDNIDYICNNFKALHLFLDTSLKDIGFDLSLIPRLRPCQKFFLRAIAPIDLEMVMALCREGAPLNCLRIENLKKMVLCLQVDLAYFDDRPLIFSFLQFQLLLMHRNIYLPYLGGLYNKLHDRIQSKKFFVFLTTGCWSEVSEDLFKMFSYIFEDNLECFVEFRKKFNDSEICSYFHYLELAALAGSRRIFNMLFSTYSMAQYPNLSIIAVQGGSPTIIKWCFEKNSSSYFYKEFLQAIRYHCHVVADWIIANQGKKIIDEYILPRFGNQCFYFNNVSFLLLCAQSKDVCVRCNKLLPLYFVLSFEWSALAVYYKNKSSSIFFKGREAYLCLNEAMRTGMPYLVEVFLIRGIDIESLFDKKGKNRLGVRINEYYPGICQCLKKYRFFFKDVDSESGSSPQQGSDDDYLHGFNV